MSAVSRRSPRASAGDSLGGARSRGERAGAWLGLLGTTGVHGAILLLAAARPAPAPPPRETIAEIDVAPPPTPPRPPDPPAAPPAPAAQAPPPPPRRPQATPAPPPDDPYDDVDTPARAAKVVTAPDSAPDSHPTIATSNEDGPGYGYVAGEGSGDSATFDPRAHVGAKPGSPPPEPPQAPAARDYTRAASVLYGLANDCEFPRGVDERSAVATVAIDVGPDGHATHVDVLVDPGHGFGAAARECALRYPYRAALDAQGRPTKGKIGPVRIRFMR